MDIHYWGALLGCSGASFFIGIGGGGLLVVRRIDAHNAAFLSEGEQERTS